jgi:hypothetical protein
MGFIYPIWPRRQEQIVFVGQQIQLHQTLRELVVLLLLLLSSAKFTNLYIFRTAHVRGVFFSVRSGAVVSQDPSAL